MNRFSDKELGIIEKYCGSEWRKRAQAVQKMQNNDSVKIVNTGMVSSGKSSLYNILINSDQKEFFPTGAARTTVKANFYNYKNISYIDTPGIDVRSEDDFLAFDTIMGADIIMMIHNIRTGPLNKSEVEWLEKITRSMSNVDMCKARIIFVISWKDTRENEEDYPILVKNVKEQVFNVIGGVIPVFEVSTKKYQQGIDKGKEILIKNSGIIELKQYVEEYVASYAKKKKENDIQEYKNIVSNIKELLKQKIEINEQEKQKIYCMNKKKAEDKRKAWRSVYDYFSMQRHELSALEKELNKI